MSGASTMLTTVSEALEARIIAGLTNGGLDQLQVVVKHTYPESVFEGDLGSTADVVVNLLFVGGRVSGHHRNIEGLTDPSGQPRPRILPLIARYLLSVHSRTDNGLNEQQVLTHIMLDLDGDPVMRANLPEPAPQLADLMGLEAEIQLLEDDTLYQTWSILGQKFRTSIGLEIGVIPLARPVLRELAPQVESVALSEDEVGPAVIRPWIEDLSTTAWQPGAEVQVFGHGFTTPAGPVTFRLGGVPVETAVHDANRATVRVPIDVPRGQTTLRAGDGDPVGVHVRAPAVYRLDPAIVESGATVTAHGVDLGTEGADVRAWIGAREVVPEAASASAVRFVVPANLAADVHALRIGWAGARSNVLYLDVRRSQ